MTLRDETDSRQRSAALTTTDELVRFWASETGLDDVVLERAIPKAIDAVYTMRDNGGNMHSAGAAAAAAALLEAVGE